MTMKRAFLAALLPCTIAMTVPAHAADRIAELQTIVEASQDDFQSIKGSLVSGETAVWRSTLAPADMLCEIEDATDQKGVKFTAFSCWIANEFATYDDVDALANEVKQAFATYFPDWKWSRSLREYPEGWGGVLLGPKENEFHVLFEQGEDEWGPLFTFRIDNLSYTVPYGVEPLAGP
jgi:hypothetical protein